MHVEDGLVNLVLKECELSIEVFRLISKLSWQWSILTLVLSERGGADT